MMMSSRKTNCDEEMTPAKSCACDMRAPARRADDVETRADAQSAMTYPLAGYKLRQGDYVMVRDQPCKVKDLKVTKPSKHGHAKMRIVGVNVFDGKKLTDVSPVSHKVYVPFVKQTTYMLLDVHPRTGVMSLLDGETCVVRDDVMMPTSGEVARELEQHLEARRAAEDRASGSCNNAEEAVYVAGEEDERDVLVTVLEAMGRAEVCQVKRGELK